MIALVILIFGATSHIEREWLVLALHSDTALYQCCIGCVSVFVDVSGYQNGLAEDSEDMRQPLRSNDSQRPQCRPASKSRSTPALRKPKDEYHAFTDGTTPECPADDAGTPPRQTTPITQEITGLSGRSMPDEKIEVDTQAPIPSANDLHRMARKYKRSRADDRARKIRDGSSST
ncbi:MAG: hypothetical protein Q9179_006506 [Wetmoreana sp. 5 TL-2023]